MRIHTYKKITLSDMAVKVVYMEELPDDEYKKHVDTIFSTNPNRDVQKFNTGKFRLMKWEVIGEKKMSYKVEKAALEAWVRTYGKPIVDSEDNEDIEE